MCYVKATAEFLLAGEVSRNQFDECQVERQHTQPPPRTRAPAVAEESQEGRGPSWGRVKDWEFAPEKENAGQRVPGQQDDVNLGEMWGGLHEVKWPAEVLI